MLNPNYFNLLQTKNVDNINQSSNSYYTFPTTDLSTHGYFMRQPSLAELRKGLQYLYSYPLYLILQGPEVVGGDGAISLDKKFMQSQLHILIVGVPTQRIPLESSKEKLVSGHAWQKAPSGQSLENLESLPSSALLEPEVCFYAQTYLPVL